MSTTGVGSPKPGSWSQRPWWPWLRRVLVTVFFALVLGLLLSQARRMDWPAVLAALQHYPLAAVGVAALLVVASFGAYSCFDLLGRHYTHHGLGTPTVMGVTFISYVFNLNLGSLVGGVAFRFRLYSRLGLAPGVITRILSLSMLTNWTGYLLLGGLTFSLMPPALPADWAIKALALRGIGVVMLIIVAFYGAMCAFSPQRTFTVRGHRLELPLARLAALQLVLGVGNWLLMSGAIYMLLQQQVAFFTVVGALLLAGAAGAVTHIPAGLGVLEAVFLSLLSHQLPAPVILAALVAYRVMYYLIPLGLAVVAYGVMEVRAKRLKPAVQAGSSSA